jgi:methyl-accepting chemotaxis protein
MGALPVKLGIQRRILLAFGLVLALPAINAAVAVWGSARVGTSANALASELFPLLDSVSTIAAGLREMGDAYEQAALFEDAERLNAAEAIHEAIQREFATAAQATQDKELRELSEDVRAYSGSAGRAARSVLAGEELGAALAKGSAGGGIAALEQRTKAYEDGLAARLGGELDGVQAVASRTLWVSGVCLLLALAIALAIALRVSGDLTRRVNGVMLGLRDIAEGEGDLSARLDANGDDELAELARCFNTFAEKLHGLISEVASVVRGGTGALSTAGERMSEAAKREVEAAERISRSLEQMAKSARTVQSHAHGLSGSLEKTLGGIRTVDRSIATLGRHADSLSQHATDTAGAIIELTTSASSIGQSLERLRDVARNTEQSVRALEESARGAQSLAGQTQELAQASVGAAGDGARSVEATVAGMSQISEGFSAIESVVAELASNSDAIESVVGVIEEISDSSRLLALNAQIIAAQSGGQGRSFAVVALEMNALAGRCSDSVKEIASRIGVVRQGARRAVAVVEQGAALVRDGATRSEHAGRALEQISERAAASTQRMRELADVIAAQSQAVSAVQRAIREVGETTVAISQATSEQARAGEGIKRSAEQVHELASGVRDGSEAQRRGSEEVTQTLESLEALVAETAGASEQQAAMAEHVSETLEVFREVAAESGRSGEEMKRVVGLLSERANQLEQRLAGFKM